MCIIFLYTPAQDDNGDYSLILAANRDESYERPTLNLSPWAEDANVIGGRDLQATDKGTWLAVSTFYKKIGILLNLPGANKIANAKSRGKIVADYVKSKDTSLEYVEKIRKEGNEFNEFVLVTVELGLGHDKPSVQTFSNSNDKFKSWTCTTLGFSNSLPENPLKKAEAGKKYMEHICCKLNKVEMKKQLVSELVGLLKSEEKHLPDPQLERRCPNMSHLLSSIFISLPEKSYGSRAHTIILVTKSGQMDIIEISLQPAANLQKPYWKTTEYQCTI